MWFLIDRRMLISFIVLSLLAMLTPDTQDVPLDGYILQGLPPSASGLVIPPIVFGAGSFSAQYNSADHIEGSEPSKSVRLALRYGIRAFDTSVYYGPSEIVLGKALEDVKDEFKREDYLIMTKCGRFGPLPPDFDYSPGRIRASVLQSLDRLKTTYLDVVYLHDVEFVSHAVKNEQPGGSFNALDSAEENLGKRILGPGDQKVIDAFLALKGMQKEGLIKFVGISGYPLQTLLRLSILLGNHTPDHTPPDFVLSYSHLNLQDASFLHYLPRLRNLARVPHVLCASPFSMGLLSGRPSGPPAWHPAPEKLRQAVDTANATAGPLGALPDLALKYTIRKCAEAHVPLLVGFSERKEVHDCVKAWRDVVEHGHQHTEQKQAEVRKVFEDAGYLDWSWSSP